MVYVITNCTKEDYDTLSTHLFKRQIVLLFKDGVAKIGVDLNSLFDLAFTAASLKCSFLFTPFNYECNGKKYHTLEIVRKEK